MTFIPTTGFGRTNKEHQNWSKNLWPNKSWPRWCYCNRKRGI